MRSSPQPSFLVSFLPSFLPSFIHSFLHSFLPSFLPPLRSLPDISPTRPSTSQQAPPASMSPGTYGPPSRRCAFMLHIVHCFFRGTTGMRFVAALTHVVSSLCSSSSVAPSVLHRCLSLVCCRVVSPPDVVLFSLRLSLVVSQVWSSGCGLVRDTNNGDDSHHVRVHSGVEAHA